MPVTHFITHQVHKDADKPAATLSFCENEALVEDYGQRVMGQLKGIFIQRSGKRYGRFSPEATQFKALTLDWLRDKQNFLSWSKKICHMFADKMDSTTLETQGYLAFIFEELVDGDKLFVFHLREKSNVALNSEMELTETRFIDFSNTGFALSVDTTALLGEAQGEYLTFSFGRGDKAVQKLFCDVSGFSDTLDTEQETQEFLQIVEEYTAAMPVEQANETRASIVDYCVEQDKHGEAVEFKILSSQLNDQAPEKFEEFVVQKRQENRINTAISEAEQDSSSPAERVPKTEFIPDRKSLKNYIRYSGKNKDLTLSFAATALGGDISFDANSSALTITNLPSRLLKQLKAQANSD